MLGRFSRILVVDDRAAARKVLRGLLSQLGFDNVEEASNGRAALRLLEKHHYRLVISDWEMEQVDGSHLLRAIRGDPTFRRLPVIMASEPGQRKFVEIARDDGVTHFLPKPFTGDMLSERIERVRRRVAA